jgi:RND family efflux transporter MFP subunit
MARGPLLFFILIALLMLSFSAVSGAEGELDCLITPYVVVNVSSAVPGLLESVTVDRGDFVKRGQVLARLESDVEQAVLAVSQAHATMESSIKASETRLALSSRKLTRNTGLFQKELITADEMDEAEATQHLAELELLEATESHTLAKLELQRTKAELKRRTVRSPITGVVEEVFLTAGEYTGDTPKPILKLAQLDPLYVEVFAPVSMLGKVEVGMTARVRPQAPIGEEYTANVTVVDKVIDAASGTFGIRLQLPNKKYLLPAGLRCRVQFLE